MGTQRDIDRLHALTGIKWRRYADDVIPAWVADMDYPTAPAILDALRSMVDSSDFGYNLASFDDSIPKAWAEWSLGRFGWKPDVARTKVFSTTLQPIAAALSVGTSPGDGVLMITPVYPPFYDIVAKAGCRLVDYRLDETEWRIDPDTLRSTIDSGTRALILCNPHNPSGRAFERAELEALGSIAEEHDLLVISDEIWQDFVYPDAEGHIPFASLGPDAAARCVTATSASKSFSLGGLGCAVAHLGNAKVAEGVAAMSPYLRGGVNALGAHATLAAWTRGEAWLTETVRVLHANRDHLVARLAAELPEVGILAPEATYLAWLDFRATGIASDPAARLLETGRVGLSPGPDFGTAGEGFARLNFATHRELLDEIIDRIVATVRSIPT
jgi:cystathionine beta-lyase